MITVITKSILITIILGVVFYFLGKKEGVKPYGYIFYGVASLFIIEVILLIAFW